jgi:hypothetical protein
MAGLFGRRSTLPALESVRSLVMPPVRAAAFWTAIALPVVYIPMLATGVVWEHPLALLTLFVLNMVAFVVGHDHNRPDGSEREV